MENEEINIDFSKIFKILWKEKWLIIAVSILFGILGVFYSLSLKEEFISEGKLLPEISSKSSGLGQYAGLAALAGVDIGGIGGGEDAVRPDLYPAVLKSTPFFLNILEQKFNTKENKKTSIRDFLISDEKVEVKKQKVNYPISPNYITYSDETNSLIKSIKSRITCGYDKKTGEISISSKMPDPVLAAEVCSYCMSYLTNYMINYRLDKQRKNLDFLAEKLANAKGKFYNNQERKASYSDQLPLAALRLQSADLQRERIESEYKISSGFYNTLLQKYEEAKLKIQQETPVIKVLEPPVAPNKKSEPNKSVIVLGFTFIGCLLSVLYSLFKNRTYMFKN